MDGPFESRAAHHHLGVDRVSSCDKSPVKIDLLPDDVLLNIFYLVREIILDPSTNAIGAYYALRPTTSYTALRDFNEWHLSWWRPLVHVCRKWRSVVFGSPNFLDLKLVCVSYTRVELTTIWPPFPIIISNTASDSMPEVYDFHAAIVHPIRVKDICVNLSSSQLQRLVSAMLEQFPALFYLSLSSRPAQALPDGFLGGSAPLLRSLKLDSISFPALPKLLLSATDLVYLSLENIPHIGYIPPEVIVTALAVLANLGTLKIKFGSHLSCPDRESRRPPPPTRTLLPALFSFYFKGVSEYLEDLVARIDAPLLSSIDIALFPQLIFSTPRLAQFMRRTPRLKALNEAHVSLDEYGVLVDLSEPPQIINVYGLHISCTVLEWQLLSLAQVFTSLFSSISMIEHLHIEVGYGFLPGPSQWLDDVEDTNWPEIFYSFTAVTNLYISKEFLESIALDLKELVGERVIHVLPALESLFLEGLPSTGPVREDIEHFVAARQLLGHPVAVSPWDKNSWGRK